MTQSDANRALGRNSLLSRERAGNFHDLALVGCVPDQKTEILPRLMRRIPCLDRAGNFSCGAGNLIGATGNRRARSWKSLRELSSSAHATLSRAALVDGPPFIEACAIIAFATESFALFARDNSSATLTDRE
jgi:hypothetical protein